MRPDTAPPGLLAERAGAADARRLAAELREAEQRNRTLVEQLPLVTYIEHLDSASASYISPQIEGLIGYSPEEWTADGEFFAKVLHPADRERVLAAFAQMHVTGEPVDTEYRFVARDGRVVWVHDSAVVVRDTDGRMLYTQGFLVDITAQKRTERALRDSEKRFRDLVAGIDVIVWEATPDLRFSFVSRRAEDILGYPIESWLNTPGFIAERVHPDDRERVLAADHAAIATGADEQLEYRAVTADGRTVWFREIVSVERGRAGNLAKLRGVMVDITEQKRAEEERTALEHQLRQAQKMEAIGRLAGGIAHDFNNLLTAILGYAELASSRLDRGGADVRTELGEIRASSERAASLTQQLLAFSRQQVMQPQVLDLNVVLGEFARLLRRLVGEEIELVTETADEPLFVEADAAQLEQVLMNLAINARDAMPDGGTLTISTAACEVDEAAARASDDARPGTFAVVSVTDTGSGIDAETRRRLFEPFFTTKELGRGTGLGLATVYGIVQQSNGFLTVDSEPGQGSTFRVFLPLSEEPRPGRRDGAGTAAPRGTERILLVEDDPVVCDLTRRVLELQGYEVLVAADPLDALACAEEYDLLLTDVVMPRMRGGELARRVRAERRGLKVLFMSGHVDGESLAGDGTEGATAFIQKPFALDDLARAVRALLDS